MKIAEYYSHLNGLEFLLVHKNELWSEIKGVLRHIDAEKCRTKISKEKTMQGKKLCSPIALNATFKKLLKERRWEESRVSYWVTKDEKLIRRTLSMKPEDQKREIELAGLTPIFSYNQTDFAFADREIDIRVHPIIERKERRTLCAQQQKYSSHQQTNGIYRSPAAFFACQLHRFASPSIRIGRFSQSDLLL